MDPCASESRKPLQPSLLRPPQRLPARGRPCSERRPRRSAKPGGRKRKRRGESGGQGCPPRTSGDGARATPKQRLSPYQRSPHAPEPVGGSSAGPAKVSSFLGGTSSLLKRSPIPASPAQWQDRTLRNACWRGVARVPRAGLAGQRSPEGEAQAARRETKPWMAEANSAGGTGDPEATFDPELSVDTREGNACRPRA